MHVTAGVLSTATRGTRRGFRYSFAQLPLGNGCDTSTAPELPGHGDVKTTVTHMHALDPRSKGMRNPTDGFQTV